MNCEKCGDRGTYEWADKVKLAGGFIVRLCTKCENAWHVYVTALPVWEEREHLIDTANDIVIAATGRDNPGAALDPIRARIRDIEDNLYSLGKAWAAGKVEVGATVAAVDPHGGVPKADE